MKTTHLIATLLGLLTVGIAATDASAYFHPGMGRFIQRDPGDGGAARIGAGAPSPVAGFVPRNQYADGMNLYQYAQGNPVRRVDPTGLWGKDFHHDLTLELAKKAGIACAADLAAGCNRPDEDERDAPSSFKAAAELVGLAAREDLAGVVGLLRDAPFHYDRASRMRAEAARRLAQAATWHFPADPDGRVTRDSTAANAVVDRGIKPCDFKLFSEGLHTLQDSWSHQGKPFAFGLGHARGAQWVEGHYEYYSDPHLDRSTLRVSLVSMRWVRGHWEKLGGPLAAVSHSADVVTIWPEDARAAAIASYRKMLLFKENCPCACPGPNKTKVSTSSGDPEKEGQIADWLAKTRFPGRNKVR